MLRKPSPILPLSFLISFSILVLSYILGRIRQPELFRLNFLLLSLSGNRLIDAFIDLLISLPLLLPILVFRGRKEFEFLQMARYLFIVSTILSCALSFFRPLSLFGIRGFTGFSFLTFVTSIISPLLYGGRDSRFSSLSNAWGINSLILAASLIPWSLSFAGLNWMHFYD